MSVFWVVFLIMEIFHLVPSGLSGCGVERGLCAFYFTCLGTIWLLIFGLACV